MRLGPIDSILFGDLISSPSPLNLGQIIGRHILWVTVLKITPIAQILAMDIKVSRKPNFGLNIAAGWLHTHSLLFDIFLALHEKRTDRWSIYLPPKRWTTCGFCCTSMRYKMRAEFWEIASVQILTPHPPSLASRDYCSSPPVSAPYHTHLSPQTTSPYDVPVAPNPGYLYSLHPQFPNGRHNDPVRRSLL